MRRLTAALLLAGLVLGAAPARGEAPRPLATIQLGNPECGQVTVVQELRYPVASLVATNQYPGEVLLELTYTLVNMVVVSEVKPLVMAAGERRTIATFRVKDTRHPYNYQFAYQWNFGTPEAKHQAGVTYGLPYPAGQQYPVIQGNLGTHSHLNTYAIDWSMPEGSPVVAARDGTVLAYHDKAVEGGNDPALRNNWKVNWVYLRHDDRTIGAYYHLKPFGVAVRPGQRVKRGQVIGYSGNTGYSTGPHLHFEVFRPAGARKNETFPAYFKVRQGGSETLKEGKTYQAP